MAYDKSDSLQQYEQILIAHGPVGLALYDTKDFRLLAMNAAYKKQIDAFGTLGEEKLQLGHSLLPWQHDLEAAGIPTVFHTVIQTGIPYHHPEFAITVSARGVVYWDWVVEPIFDENNTVVQLHITVHNVTQQALEHKRVQQNSLLLLEAQRIAEGERKRLEVVDTVARSVQASLNTERVGQAVVESIQAHFPTLRVAVHTADATQHVLHMLHAYTAPGNEATFCSMQSVPYTSKLLVARARHHHDPLVIEDEQTALIEGILERDTSALRNLIRGYVCVPLWFHEQFEGTLTAVFENPIEVDGPEVRTLTDCGMHIATALAHARIHKAVEQERLHLYQVLDRLPEGIVILAAPEARISYANEAAARIFGIPLSTLVGKDIAWLGKQTAIATTDNRPLSPPEYAVNMALQGEAVKQRENRISRPDGSVVVTLSSTVPLRSAYGTIDEAISVFLDITERKSVEEQKNEFLSIASHELRTPITSIKAYAQILQLTLARGIQLDAERLQRTTTIMIEQSDHLERMIEELLELSRIETAQLSLHLERCDLIAMLRTFVDNHRLISKRHNLHLILDVPPPMETLVGMFDKGRMEQVLNNLLNNAIKYSAAGSEVEVGLRYREQTPDEVVIWVKDQGIGIADEDLPRIFDRFHRVGNLDRSITGFGIGLYLVKEFITRHQGQVWVESVGGEGSTFWIRLPRLLNR